MAAPLHRRAGRRTLGPVRLVALLDGRVVGAIHRQRDGTLRFAYDDAWRLDPEAYPVSLSLPLAAAVHGDRAVTAFLWGLLPDNERTLAHYGRLFGVSPRSPVALLAHIGADCAGAIQFAEPHSAAALEGPAGRGITVEWLTEAEVARELRSARERGIPGDTARTVGQFSLAGAQPKIALLGEGDRWGRPTGRTPTTHILKPPSGEHAGFAENEHFCLDLAHRLGLGVVRSRVLRFEREVAVVVNRFDRAKRGGAYHRVHQEDVCQALAVMPDRKYESQGGPGVTDVVTLLRGASRAVVDDVDRFVRATVLTWVLAATDAHAKNYALLHGPGQDVRLAPFYDIASYLPYGDAQLHRVRLAMSIGGEYLVRRIVPLHWSAQADESGLEVDRAFATLRDMLLVLPDLTEDTRVAAVRGGLNAKFVNALARRIAARVARCSKLVGG